MNNNDIQIAEIRNAAELAKPGAPQAANTSSVTAGAKPAAGLLPDQKSFTLRLAEYRENKTNTQYPNAATVKGLPDLLAAARKDHIAPAMRGDHRSKNNFLFADCVMLDLDNTHSDDPEEWRTVDDVVDAFPGVRFYYVHSRNHMKVKTKTKDDGTVIHYEARPKYHFYFPLSSYYNEHDQYEAIMLKAAGLFPYFDLGAAKPAQFFYGIKDPSGGESEGEQELDTYLREQPAEAVEAAVQAFVSKVKEGIYNSSSETERAISRLYSYLGKSRPAIQSPEAAGDTITSDDGETLPGYSPLGLRIAKNEQQRSLLFVEEFAGNHNIELGRRYVIESPDHPKAIAICVECPWEDTHTEAGPENDSIIIIELGGKIGYLCRHSHCTGRSWKDYRAYYEERDTEPAEGPTEAATDADTLPGLLTYSDAVEVFQKANHNIITFERFPNFGATAKIRVHDSVVIAADTGAGKSSLALNFLHDLNGDYPCIYLNLEMDTIDVLQRLVAIQGGTDLDFIEQYQTNEGAKKIVDSALEWITSPARKPLQVIQGAYYLNQIEDIIKRSTAGREEPTIVFIDHSLLVDTQKSAGSRYDRFTQVSEGLRKMALSYNIILFVLLQQSRAGKASEEEPPKNSSLKESGSWENDATQICFLWYDPTARRKKLLLTKNRHGVGGEFLLEYEKNCQTYREQTSDVNGNPIEPAKAEPGRPKVTRRQRQRQRLETAYRDAYSEAGRVPTLHEIAEAADVTTSTVKSWLKEYGGATIDGQQIEAAGADTQVEYTGFVKMSETETTAFDDKKITAWF